MTIPISGLTSTGALKSPNYSGSYNNTHRQTKVVFESLPKSSWVNLVYLPAETQTGCGSFPFDIHVTSSYKLKEGCTNKLFNKEVPNDSMFSMRTVDVIFTNVNNLTLVVRENEAGLKAFRLFYSSKLLCLQIYL